jgi:glycosyltransferase involved in cell wall biosynthesis
MRIMLITPGFSADEDDWRMPAVRNLAAELARRGDLRILALHYPYRKGSYAVTGARVHALGGANKRGLRRAWLLLRAVAWTIGEHRRRPADVLHGLWADEAGAVAVAAGRLLRIPAVASLTGGELVALPDIGYGGGLSRLGRRITPQALRHATRVTAGSASLERLATPHVPTGRLVRLPLGVDTELFSPGPPLAAREPLADGAVRLLCVASLTPVKDHATLLRALARIADQVPGVQLHLVGDGPLRTELALQADALGVARRVSFHGAVPHDRLPHYYRAADLLVLSSRYESQAMVALEAAACGCPVVGTAVGVLPELPCARVVPVGDAAALADAIAAAVSERGAPATPEDGSREAVRAEFGLERTVEELCSLYRQVLASGDEAGGHAAPA